ELNIPQDALSFSVYDIEQEEYLFYEGDSQLPTVASLAKLFVIDYALKKVDLEDVVEVNQEVLELVPVGSSLANLKAGQYTVKQIMEAMLVPSGNDAAYALAYHIAKNELGEGYTVTEYIDYFMTELHEYLIEEGYSKTNLYNDPSGASMQADTHLDDINHVALKLLNYDFVRECIGESSFSIQTPQGEFTWKNTNEFLDKNSPYYNANVKGMKTGTMASSYSIVVLYEKDEKEYLITCLAALSNEGRYKAVQSAINTIIK
ncbi:MAG TPA: D-alanyl-D-alanine carboxypeptidase, partial [Lachnospiraceae bacterium]|nr:D-alanyl-D-alanine carboxypeptidase [Lachnospiraceae bacterium]